MGSSSSRPVYIERDPPNRSTSRSRSRRNSVYRDPVPRRSKSLSSRNRIADVPNANNQIVLYRPQSQSRNFDQDIVVDADKPDTYIRANKRPGKHNTYALVKQDTKSRPEDEAIVTNRRSVQRVPSPPPRRFREESRYWEVEDDRHRRNKAAKRKDIEYDERSSLAGGRRPDTLRRGYSSEEDVRSRWIEDDGYAIRWKDNEDKGRRSYQRYRDDTEVDVYPVTKASTRRPKRSDFADETRSTKSGFSSIPPNFDRNVQHGLLPTRRREADMEPIVPRHRGSTPHRSRGANSEEEFRAAPIAVTQPHAQNIQAKGFGEYLQQGNNYLRQAEGMVRTGEGLFNGAQELFR